MRFATASITEAGPRTVNEDSIGIWNLPGGAVAVAVADGLGGMGGGDTASGIAIQLFGNAVTKEKSTQPNLSDLAKLIHSQIRSTQAPGSSESTMATTLTAAIFRNSTVAGVHCGDSRAAIARENGILRLTKDHTEAQRLFDQGKLSKSELINYPRQNILDSALGARKEPKIDVFDFDVHVGDKFFFTSDGMHEKVFLREMRAIAADFSEPSPFVEKMRAIVENRGAEDNFSLIAVFVQD
ncbi:MAG: protein phosphatase 2C domain-containing protein [Nitratireductor sp.]